MNCQFCGKECLRCIECQATEQILTGFRKQTILDLGSEPEERATRLEWIEAALEDPEIYRQMADNFRTNQAAGSGK